MKTTTTLSVLFALLLAFGLAPQAANAQIDVGVQGGYNLDVPNKVSDDGLDEGAFSLGGQLRLSPQALPVVLNPSFDYYFTGIDGANYYQLDVNALYEFSGYTTTFTPYVGAGLGVTRANYDDNDLPDFISNDDTQTDYGVNLIGGFNFGFGNLRPFAQARITLGEHAIFPDDDGQAGAGYELQGGLLFRFGQ